MGTFPYYWHFVRRIPRPLVNSPHKGQWRGALMFSLICAWINGWVNNGEAGNLRRHRAHYGVIVMRVWQQGHFMVPSQWLLVDILYNTGNVKLCTRRTVMVLLIWPMKTLKNVVCIMSAMLSRPNVLHLFLMWTVVESCVAMMKS